MKKLVFLTASLLLLGAYQAGDASAQLVGPPQNCNEFEVTDETVYNGIVHHTPYILLACDNGLFMEHGSNSGQYSGTIFLAASLSANADTFQGAIVENNDGSGCGPTSFNVDGEIVDGQTVFIHGLQPIRVSASQALGCMNTGEVSAYEKTFVLTSQPVQNQPPPSSYVGPVGGSSSAASTGGGSGSSSGVCGLNAGTFIGGALGGLAGSQFGSGSGNKAAIAAGVVLGAAAGTQAGCR